MKTGTTKTRTASTINPRLTCASGASVRDISMLHPVKAPPLRHASELVHAAIREADLRLRHQIPDRARDQHLAGTRFGGDARADVNRETDKLLPAHLVFAGVQPAPDLQPQRAHGL